MSWCIRTNANDRRESLITTETIYRASHLLFTTFFVESSIKYQKCWHLTANGGGLTIRKYTFVIALMEHWTAHRLTFCWKQLFKGFYALSCLFLGIFIGRRALMKISRVRYTLKTPFLLRTLAWTATKKTGISNLCRLSHSNC